jgi:hypothetical protein
MPFVKDVSADAKNYALFKPDGDFLIRQYEVNATNAVSNLQQDKGKAFPLADADLDIFL